MRRVAVIVAIGVVVAACQGGPKKSASAPTPTPSQSSPTSEMPPNTVQLAGRSFSPGVLSVGRGTTVTWVDISNGFCASGLGDQIACPHNVVSVDNLFNSHPQCTGPGTPCMNLGEPFRYTFTAPGTFAYYCFVHATCSDGTCAGMTGRVVVT